MLLLFVFISDFGSLQALVYVRFTNVILGRYHSAEYLNMTNDRRLQADKHQPSTPAISETPVSSNARFVPIFFGPKIHRYTGYIMELSLLSLGHFLDRGCPLYIFINGFKSLLNSFSWVHTHSHFTVNTGDIVRFLEFLQTWLLAEFDSYISFILHGTVISNYKLNFPVLFTMYTKVRRQPHFKLTDSFAIFFLGNGETWGLPFQTLVTIFKPFPPSKSEMSP